MKVFLQRNYEREPLDLKLRNIECANCGVLHKRGNLNRYKVCSSGKCIRTIFGVIPECFRRLTEKQLDCLRFVQIYSRKQCSNSSYMYERYKGTANLSVNWRVWKQCGGLVGFNNDYNKMKQVYPPKVITAIRWLIRHIWNYKRDNPFAKKSGEVFTTLRKIDERQLGTDDANFKVLPVGLKCSLLPWTIKILFCFHIFTLME